MGDDFELELSVVTLLLLACARPLPETVADFVFDGCLANTQYAEMDGYELGWHWTLHASRDEYREGRSDFGDGGWLSWRNDWDGAGCQDFSEFVFYRPEPNAYLAGTHTLEYPRTCGDDALVDATTLEESLVALDGTATDLGVTARWEYRYDEDGNEIAERRWEIADGQEDLDYTMSQTWGDGLLLQRDWDDDSDGVVESVTRWTYDERGNELTETRWDLADGEEVVDVAYLHTYDDLDRLVRRDQDDSGDGTVESTSTYTYADDTPRVVEGRKVDAAGALEWAWSSTWACPGAPDVP